MSRVSSLALAAVLSLAVPTVVGAQTMPHETSPSQEQGSQMGPGNMMGGRMMGGRMMMQDCPMMNEQNADAPNKQLEKIKAELGITDAQQTAWNSYAQQVSANWSGMTSMHERMQAMRNAKTPVERLDARITMMNTRLTHLTDMKPKLQALYDSLTPDQKGKADRVLSPMGCMM